MLAFVQFIDLKTNHCQTSKLLINYMNCGHQPRKQKINEIREPN